MRSNVLEPSAPVFTHEGAKGKAFPPFKELERAVLTCLLFEDTFYEKGSDIATRMADLVTKCEPGQVAGLAIKARNQFYLRHVPLFLARELMRNKKNGPFVEEALTGCIQRPDELGEFFSMISKEVGPKNVRKAYRSHAAYRAIRAAFQQFNAYELAKWDRNSDAIKLRDVMRLVHPKPIDETQSAMWKKLIAGELETPDTWETELSAGKDKKETFTRLISEKKLGGLALLRNLRNCIQSGVDSDLLRNAIREHPFKKVLPFRFLAAATHAKQLEPELDKAMERAATSLAKLGGRTALLIDVSGSMDAAMSAKSDLTRMDAACGTAIMGAYLSEQFMVATFSNAYVEVPPRTGMALRDAVVNSQIHGGTELGKALVDAYRRKNGFADADRVIVITDEQSHDTVPSLIGGNKQFRYLVNVAPNKNGVSEDGSWHRINGFSEAIFTYIQAHEEFAASR